MPETAALFTDLSSTGSAAVGCAEEPSNLDCLLEWSASAMALSAQNVSESDKSKGSWDL